MVSVKPSYLTYAIVSSVSTALSAACVTLRFFQRQRVGGLQWDDWTILLAVVMSVACLVVVLLPTSICPRVLQDDPNIKFTDTELNTWTKTLTATQMFYAGNVTLSRSSIVIFYRRIFSVDTRFLICTHFMLFFIVAAFLAFVFVAAFAYTPVEAQWDVSKQATSSNIQTRVWAMTLSAIYTLLDILVFLMAAYRTWKLQIDKKRKILLSLLFFVGTLPLIAVIMRLSYFSKNVPRLGL
ncbi:hypothetical protein INS49_003923 [Diaporthe citri]|uniref:uncharacterized protein n=1 Tax=Diaporthe citri TaxID=83186 RepID=UPI001C80CAD2|nr:uncharacterized protein INS49_003923 [Diaporthe citri]KAG6354842.1 hypothetical protein INS49_003923 [Diaporthe citri]